MAINGRCAQEIEAYDDMELASTCIRLIII